MEDLRPEAKVLRQLIAEYKFSHSELSILSNIPKERIDTLTRGNAPMRVQEASVLANIFDRSISVFANQDLTNDIRIFASRHKSEIQSFKKIVVATDDLNRIFKTNPYDKNAFSKVPKDQYYAGSVNGTYNLAQRESQLANVIFDSVSNLESVDSTLLAGDNQWIVSAITMFMRRWWKGDTDPRKIANVRWSKEDEEKEKRDIYSELRRLFLSTEAFENDEFNPVSPELHQKLAGNGLLGTIKTLRQVEYLYFQTLTNLQVYDYFRFIKALQHLEKKTNTLLGDSKPSRIANLKRVEATDLNTNEIYEQIFSLHPITFGYSVTYKQPSDTELTRLIIEANQLKWYFDPSGEVLASDTLTVVAASITDLAARMRALTFFAGDIPNQSSGVHWERIPDNELDLIKMLNVN
jgi:hypothetical protein